MSKLRRSMSSMKPSDVRVRPPLGRRYWTAYFDAIATGELLLKPHTAPRRAGEAAPSCPYEDVAAAGLAKVKAAISAKGHAELRDCLSNGPRGPVSGLQGNLSIKVLKTACARSESTWTGESATDRPRRFGAGRPAGQGTESNPSTSDDRTKNPPISYPLDRRRATVSLYYSASRQITIQLVFKSIQVPLNF